MSEYPKPDYNPLLARLLAIKAYDAISLIGYVALHEEEDRIALYPNLFDLSKSFEFKHHDIIYQEEAPKSILPFGGFIFWLKKDSEVISRQIGKSGDDNFGSKIQAANEEIVKIQLGRLSLTMLIPVLHTSPCHRVFREY
jgi:hypothetical protein